MRSEALPRIGRPASEVASRGPPPRDAWGRFVGPEATVLDHVLTVGTAAAGAIAAAIVTRRRGGSRTAAGASAVLAADLVGGAYVNNTLASARWYERPGQGHREHLGFAACHIHPMLVAWMDRGRDGRGSGTRWAVGHYAYLMIATTTIRGLPHLRRPLGVLATAGALMLDARFGRSHLVPWFAWSYHTKLLMGHAGASLWPDRELEP